MSESSNGEGRQGWGGFRERTEALLAELKAKIEAGNPVADAAVFDRFQSALKEFAEERLESERLIHESFVKVAEKLADQMDRVERLVGRIEELNAEFPGLVEALKRKAGPESTDPAGGK